MDKPDCYTFTTTHIDVARNATDDFNLFHDKLKWNEIQHNPFDGPIVLGFQLLGLIASKINQHRLQNNELELIETNKLDFSYFQLKFAGAVKPEQSITVNIKKSQFKQDSEFQLANRFSLNADNKLALIGYKRELQSPNILTEFNPDELGNVHQLPDRSFVGKNNFFVKHKFFNTSNGKNFLVGSLVEQSLFFDEIMDKVCFPEVFPLALTSCALLERAKKFDHDFRQNPLVYVSHQHCTDRRLLATLKSNMQLTMLVQHFSSHDSQLETAHCYGIIDSNKILFRSELCLSPLPVII